MQTNIDTKQLVDAVGDAIMASDASGVIMNNNGVYRGDEVNVTGGKDPSPLVFVKGARYEKLMEAFGGVGVLVNTPTELRAAMEEAIKSGKPTLINAVIDEGAGTESGRITSLNPTSAAKKK